VARPHPAWGILALAFAAVALPAALRGLLAVMTLPIEAETGWDRWVASAAAGTSMLLFGALGPFVAAAVVRWGGRRVMLAGLAMVVASLVWTPFAREPWAFVAAWGVLGGLGSGVLGIVFGNAVVGSWFVRRRGLATGILGAGIAASQLLVLPPAAWLVEAVGWRAGVVLGIALAGVTWAAAWRWMRDSPEDAGTTAYGSTAAPDRPGHARATPPRSPWPALRRGMRSPAFWLLAFPFFVCGLTTGGLIAVHLVPASIEHGIAPEVSVLILAVVGVLDFAGSIASGWLSDRWNAAALLAGYYGIRAVSLAALPLALAAGLPGLVPFALVYGLGWVATVAPTARIANQAFGVDGPVVFGWVYTAHQVGAFVAAVGAGVVHDVVGSYAPVFAAAAAMAAGAAATSLMLVPGARGGWTRAGATEA
jgi:predicted MFS family arabinose efflux permease